MPGFTPAVGDLIQVRLQYRAGSQLAINVLNYRVSVLVGGGMTLQQIADYFDGSLSGPLIAWLPTVANYESVSVQNMQPPITVPYESGLSAAPGSVVGGVTPRQASGLISTKTALGGRSNRGRVYVGFVPKASVDADGELTGGATANLQAIADAIGPTAPASLGAQSTTLILQVRHPNTVGPPPLPSSTEVVSLAASAGIATQRRRGDFGSPN